MDKKEPTYEMIELQDLSPATKIQSNSLFDPEEPTITQIKPAKQNKPDTNKPARNQPQPPKTSTKTSNLQNPPIRPNVNPPSNHRNNQPNVRPKLQNNNRSQPNPNNRSNAGPMAGVPMMSVTCGSCTFQQSVQGNAQVFVCGVCENMNRCDPHYNLFICCACKSKVCYPLNTSQFVRCTRCGVINQVPTKVTLAPQEYVNPRDIKEVPLVNQNPLPRREEEWERIEDFEKLQEAEKLEEKKEEQVWQKFEDFGKVEKERQKEEIKEGVQEEEIQGEKIKKEEDLLGLDELKGPSYPLLDE